MLLVTDPAATDLGEVERAVRRRRPRPDRRTAGELVEIPVTYDGEDLDEVAGTARLRRRRSRTPAHRRRVDGGVLRIRARASATSPARAAAGTCRAVRRPRTKVPPGSVALAGEFSGVYPRASPGGWQLIGRTELAVFDLHRDPPALLRPGAPVRFVDVGRA